MRKRTITLWRLNEDGRKQFAGTIMAASSPGRARRQMVAFLATFERGVYFAKYRVSFVGPETALESGAGGLAA